MSLLEKTMKSYQKALSSSPADSVFSSPNFVEKLANTLYNDDNSSSVMTLDPLHVPSIPASDDTVKGQLLQTSNHLFEENTVKEEDQVTKVRNSMDSEVEKSWENVHDALRSQYMAQYKQVARYDSLLEQYQENERYWRERCHQVEEQLDAMNDELREMERSQYNLNPDRNHDSKNVDKDEIIRRLHAKIASRDSVIESLEEQIEQKERSRRASKTASLHRMIKDQSMEVKMHGLSHNAKSFSTFMKIEASKQLEPTYEDRAFAA